MPVSGQERRLTSSGNGADSDKGPRARMRKMMLDSAMRLMQEGMVPSITDVAEAAQVSRATAYRYFPTQSALIHAAVDEALGPILRWTSESEDAEERVSQLLTFAYPRMDSYEATLKAALRLALDQWARQHAGRLGDEEPIARGRRIPLLRSAIAPLRRELGKPAQERLLQALSLIFGTEALVVLKDVWALDEHQAEDVALWTCRALIRAAQGEALAAGKTRGRKAKPASRSMAQQGAQTAQRRVAARRESVVKSAPQRSGVQIRRRIKTATG